MSIDRYEQNAKPDRGPENWASKDLDERLEICRDLNRLSAFTSIKILKEEHQFTEEEARKIICLPEVKGCPLFYCQLEEEYREDLEVIIKNYTYQSDMPEALAEQLHEWDEDYVIDPRECRDLEEWLKEFKAVYACPKWYFMLPEEQKQQILEIITNLGETTPLRVLLSSISEVLQTMIDPPVPTQGDVLDFLHWIAQDDGEKEMN